MCYHVVFCDVPSVSNIAAILVSAFSLYCSGGATRRCYSIFKHMNISDTLWKHLILKKIKVLKKRQM